MSIDNLERLCHYLGCDLHDLECIPSEPPQPRKKADAVNQAQGY